MGRFTRTSPRSRKTSGTAMAAVLVITFCLMLLMAGTGTQVVAQLGTTRREKDYERALQMAEAGANAYLNRMTYSTAVSGGSYLPPLATMSPENVPSESEFREGVFNRTYSIVRYPAGSEQGYYAARVGSSTPITVVSYGWSHGVVRRVTTTSQPTLTWDDTVTDSLIEPPGDYIVYAITQLTVQCNITVRGNVGTNGDIVMQNNNLIDGVLSLNGPDTSLDQHNNNTLNVIHTPEPIYWPTVDEIALSLFPGDDDNAGGLEWIQAHSDNARATINGVPGIRNYSIDLDNKDRVVFPGKPGGANYYLNWFSMKNNCTLILDNALGAVTIWFGPSGGYGGLVAQNGVVFNQTSSDPAKACRLYFGTTGGLLVQNNMGTGIGIYAYNRVGSEKIGSVTILNNGTFGGSIIANDILMQDNNTVRYAPGPYFRPNGTGFLEVFRWRP